MFMKHLFCFILLLYNATSRPKEVRCPEYCKCDVYETLRRATCQNRTLYSVEIDIPPIAQILDLSYNQISELGANVFLEIGLSDLKLLNLSHNKVGHIHLHGFEGLDRLKTLDMSFNMLEYFNEQWFVSLNSLQELYLRGNSLKSINEEPRLNLNYLRVLDLSLCRIIALRPGVLNNVPNLEILDVSENLLDELQVAVVQPLKKLNILLAKGNMFNCKNYELVQLRSYTKSKGISYKDPCEKNRKKSKTEMFQRMIVEPQAPEKNVWIYDEEEDNFKHTRTVKICSTNTTNHTITLTDNIVNKTLLGVIEMSPVLAILFVLVFGITLGLILGCSIQLDTGQKNLNQFEDIDLQEEFLTNRRDTLNNRRYQRQNGESSIFRPRTRSTGTIRRMMREDRNILMMHESHLSDSTPVVGRKNYLNKVVNDLNKFNEDNTNEISLVNKNIS